MNEPWMLELVGKIEEYEDQHPSAHDDPSVPCFDEELRKVPSAVLSEARGFVMAKRLFGNL